MKPVQVVICACFIALLSFGQSVAQDVQSALAPLPEELRDGAEVYVIDMDGDLSVIREGSNGMACRASIPSHQMYWARCHQSEYSGLYNHLDTLILLEGKSPEEALELVSQEIEEGSLPRPVSGSATYLIMGETEEAASMTTAIILPDTEAADLGLGTEEDSERPWVMWGGSVMSHLMIHGEH